MCGLLGFATCVSSIAAIILGFVVFWPLGLVLGFRARKDAQQNGNSTALSTTAIVISICSAAVLGLGLAALVMARAKRRQNS